MKKLFTLSTLAALLASANAYAHHPAADIVDPDVYAMIEENISDVHLALDFDDMGSPSTDMGGAMASADDAGNMAADMGSDLAGIGSDLDEVGAGMSELAQGSMGAQR
ncbi:MAG: hypothetical protein WBN96_00525 [Gammaproteobacteria bacterium]